MRNVGRLLRQIREKGVPGYLRHMLSKGSRRARRNRAFADFFGQFVGAGDLCFDVGANIGQRTRVFVELGARVVSVEPQPACAEQIRTSFRGRPVVVEQVAVGSSEGSAQLNIASLSSVSTMSSQWIDRARSTGRFGAIGWREPITVPLTTLDGLIERHGLPRFVKIDVEGYELEVIRGLTRTVPALSFEFIAEDLEAVARCAAHLSSLGPAVFSFALADHAELAIAQWVPADRLVECLGALPDRSAWGDVYVRFPGA
jgi:FkbM family methyltransferase